ncbi:MAG: UDP-N-acetylmuramoyl-tripeptide--D-alanyl-D-alanine ligase, partial [Clostridia bacterium]|nr:UDP-N-acetylmuramoyl-tripeptide--D-alanyl-D-alanine ligase [Clostridia bacterium]
LDYETMYFGMKNPKCDIVAENVKTYPESSEFTFKADGGERRVIIGTPGAHHIYNALTAILVGMQYNVPIDDIICGIREFVPVGMRQAMVRLGGCTLIKDCYNANPTSMRSGLEVLSLKADAKRRVACLGDMMELGTISEQAHREVGRLIPEFNVYCLITVGERAKLIAEGAKGAGMSADNIHSFENNGQLCDNIMDILEDGDVMLLKASRSMRLEEIAEFLEKKLTNR